jgi:alpha-maltose-1-phosphate synthase
MYMACEKYKPKIAFLNFSNTSGMLHYVLNMGVAAAVCADVYFVDVGDQQTADYRESSSKCFFYHWPTSSGLRRIWNKYNPHNFRKLANAINSHIAPDIVHITSSTVGMLALVLRLKALGIKVIHTLHDPTPHEEQRTLWGTIYETYQNRIQLPLAVRYFDFLHVHSDLHKQIVKDKFGAIAAAKTYVVEHGAGFTSSIQNGSAKCTELEALDANNSLKVLFFGRLEHYKGLEYLIRAHHILEQRGIDCRLIIAGDGVMPATAPIPEKTILIKRYVRDDEVKSLFSACDIVALPYISATQSGVIPFAYTSGKPVICTRVGALPDVVIDGKTGILIEKNNEFELANALMKLAENPALLGPMGRNAETFFKERLSWNKVIEGHCEIYQKLSFAGINTSDTDNRVVQHG